MVEAVAGAAARAAASGEGTQKLRRYETGRQKVRICTVLELRLL